MTAKKDLKRRIRERQERTGEDYVVARRAVLAEGERPAEDQGNASPTLSKLEPEETRPAGGMIGGAPTFAVVELNDISAEAKEYGFRCTVSIAHRLAAEIDPRAALQQLREAVMGTTADPSMEAFRAVALRGERPTRTEVADDWQDAMNRFVLRVRAGIGGVSEAGTMLALPVETRRGMTMMICQLGFGIVRQQNPAITLTTEDTASFYIERVAIRSLR